MRHITKLILFILLTSCKDKSHRATKETLPEHLSLVTTSLKDSLGAISFSVPARFDTSFTWTNFSDCGKPCDHEQYRYQPKTLPVFKESGYYYDTPNIPLDQFTIIHSGYVELHNGDTSKNLEIQEIFKRRISSQLYNGTIRSDTMEKIGDRYFSIVCFSGYDKENQKHFANVAALTTIKSNDIELHYEIRTKDTINWKGFYENAIRLLRTVRISNSM